MRGWGTSGVRIHAASAVRDLDLMPKEDVGRAIQLIRYQMNQVRQAWQGRGERAQPLAPAQAPLEALKLRLAKGEISPEEYERSEIC